MLQPIVEDMPLVEYIYRRCLQSKEADLVVVITSTHSSDNRLNDYCIKHGMEVFRGSLDNVLDRYVSAADFFQADVVCRVCGDSPFVDIELIDRMFTIQQDEKLDYVALEKNTFIAGFDSEIISTLALKKSKEAGVSDKEAEHVTLYLKANQEKFKTKFIKVDLCLSNLKDISLTVDYPRDLLLCQEVVKSLDDAFVFKSKEVLNILLKNKNVPCVS